MVMIHGHQMHLVSLSVLTGSMCFCILSLVIAYQMLIVEAVISFAGRGNSPLMSTDSCDSPASSKESKCRESSTPDRMPQSYHHQAQDAAIKVHSAPTPSTVPENLLWNTVLIMSSFSFAFTDNNVFFFNHGN